MKFATVATGGIGGFLAVKLARMGEDVACLARGAHLDAIRRKGLTLREDGQEVTARPRIATADPAQIGKVDVVILAVKARDIDGAAELARPMIGPETAVIPFLNGVEAAPRLAELLPEGAVMKGTAYVSTTIAEPGVIARVGGFARFVFGEFDDSRTARVEAVRAAFRRAGVDAPDCADIEAEIWRKFCLFAAVSGVTSAGRCTMGAVRSDPHLARVFRDAVGETARLARARGVGIDADIEDKVWKLALGLPSEMQASTAIDLAAGRPLEVDAISGAVARLSEAAGLEAPVNRTLYAVLRPFRDGARAR